MIETEPEIRKVARVDAFVNQNFKGRALTYFRRNDTADAVGLDVWKVNVDENSGLEFCFDR